MPYQFEQPNAHFKIRKEHDRRVKLTDDDKFDIKWLFEKENFTIRSLARFFNVDKRTKPTYKTGENTSSLEKRTFW